MIVRRNDERRRERSIDVFGRAMEPLGRRQAAARAADAARTEFTVAPERRIAAPATSYAAQCPPPRRR